jgi:hypothetical protein
MKAKTKQEELQQEAQQTAQSNDLVETPSQPNMEDRIRQRAYELSQQRDTYDGDPVNDWYRAEAEVRAAFSSPEFDGLTEAEEGGRRLSARAS